MRRSLAFQDQPIRRKLMLSTMLTSLVALSIACAAFATHDLFSFRGEMLRELERLSDIMRENSPASLVFRDAEAATETLSSLRAISNISSAAIYDADGNLFAEYRQSETGSIPLLPPPSGFIYAPGHVALTQPILLEGERLGTVYVQSSLDELYEQLKRYGLILTGVLLLSSLAAFLLSTRTQQVIARPIHSLAGAAEAVSRDKDFSIRVEVQANDEIGRLTKTFNEMLAHIQQHARELVQAKEQAEEMARLKASFLTNMSHEIRTPLTGLIGAAQILAEEVAESHREFADIVESGAKRLLNTINSVLDMARIEAGEMDMTLESCNVVREIKEVLHRLRPLAAKKGIALTWSSSDEEVDALLDTRLLHRVLHNVIGNAIKFTEEGSVHVHLSATSGHLTISVRDTGLGIAESFLPHVFDDFKQESTGEARMFEGSGLGLAITKRVVALMNGKIEVESTQGIGSVFTTVLPRYIVENTSILEPGAAPASANEPEPFLTEVAS